MSSGLCLAVHGAGAWGTALALAFAREGHPVWLWSRETAHVAAMQRDRENRDFLPGFAFPPEISPVDDIAATSAADVHLIVTPVAGLRATLALLRGTSSPVLWACKGFEPGSGLLPHAVAAEVLGPDAACGVLSGPSFAQEVAAEQPTAVTLACADPALSRRLAGQLNARTLRIYAHDDVAGVEVGGAVKNVMAIAAGIADGLGFGHNARAALITRGLAEISRLGRALGGHRETFSGLSGLGDLVLTCTGDLSRNRQVGLGLGKGRTLDDILASLGHVAEGVGTAREVARLAHQLGIDMPISQAVAAVLAGALPAAEAVDRLLARTPRPEFGG